MEKTKKPLKINAIKAPTTTSCARRVTRLALVGCTEAEIASIIDHNLRDGRSILDAHYLAPRSGTDEGSWVQSSGTLTRSSSAHP